MTPGSSRTWLMMWRNEAAAIMGFEAVIEERLVEIQELVENKIRELNR